MKARAIKNNKSRRGMEGFSLIELVIVCVILVFILGIIAAIVRQTGQSYAAHRPRMEALNDATAALDMMKRLIRMAGNNPENIADLQGIDPGTAAGGIYRTIRIRADWRGIAIDSSPDGDTNDPYEDTTFSVDNGVMMKLESPADPAPVEFLNSVGSLRFTYYDTNNTLIPDPVSENGQIARVDIELVTQTPETTPMTFKTSAYLRRRR